MTAQNRRTTIIAGLLAVGALLTFFACGGGGGLEVTPPATPKTVSVVGTGSGRVTSTDGKLDCKLTAGATSGPKCSASVDSGTVVTITATPDADQEFKAWGTDCTGSTTCQLTVNRNMVASATFVRAIETLSLEFATPAPDDGATIIRIDGPSVLGVVGTAGLEVAARPLGTAATTSRTIMVRGNLTSGVVARVNIRGIHVGSVYTATVVSVAARQSAGYVQRQTLTAYQATLKP